MIDQNLYYRLNEKYAQSSIDGRFLFMTSESDCVLFQSELAVKLVETISTQTLSSEDLLENFSKTYAIGDILLMIQQLEKEGYITNKQSPFPRAQTAYWQELGFDVQRLAKLFQEKSIQLKVFGDVPVSHFVKACDDLGLKWSYEPDLIIVFVSDYLHPALEKFNKKAILEGKPWVLIKNNGTRPYIGPYFNPNDAALACWSCLQHRLLLHDQENKLYQAMGETNAILDRPQVGHPLAEQLVANMALMEIVSLLYEEKAQVLRNKVIEFNVKYGTRHGHDLVKRPQCSTCGSHELFDVHPEPITLNDAISANSYLGGYRTVAPEETLKKYEHHVSPITGVVPCLEPYYKNTDVPVYNFTSGRNLALQSTSMFWLNQHLRSANGGKGKEEIQAKTGALCEAIERYSLMYHDKTYTVQSSFKKLAKAIHPNKCMNFSAAQYENREALNASSSKFYALIPQPFDTDEVIDWTPVYSLSEKEFKYLPSCYCYAQYPAEDERLLYSYPDSNGCAAGNTLDEAILQGFLELVERDAAAIWWYNQLERPSVDLYATRNEYIEQMLVYYEEINRSLHVLDITTDFNIPVFVAISHITEDTGSDKIIYAFGAHLDANIALERAIVELNQLLPLADASQDAPLSDSTLQHWFETVKIEDHPYLMPSREASTCIQTDYPQLCKPSISAGVQYCIDKAQSLALETLVLDLTQPDIGLPVAKVIVPGLRHFWRRTAPGRLFDVPVKLQWIDHPKKEEALNPYSIFI